MSEIGGALVGFPMLTMGLPLAANGFVTLDISKDLVNVEYYARDMEFENGDLYPVNCDLKPSYSFQITQKAT